MLNEHMYVYRGSFVVLLEDRNYSAQIYSLAHLSSDQVSGFKIDRSCQRAGRRAGNSKGILKSELVGTQILSTKMHGLNSNPP